MADTLGGQALRRFLPLSRRKRRFLRKTLTSFLEATEDEVIDRFSGLPGALLGPDGEDYVYVPGKREDRVLLVAHADVAREMQKRVIHWDEHDVAKLGEGTIPVYAQEKYGKDKGKWRGQGGCLGADDRAGCSALWLLRDSGHSLLITRGEEKGCIGARRAVDVLQDELCLHQFAIEIDRRGVREFVTYMNHTQEFLDFLKDKFPEFTKEYGSFSDIAEICPSARICGVNLAAGYMHEHSDREFMHLDSWYLTVSLVQDLLAQANLPKFDMTHSRGVHRRGGRTTSWDSDWYNEERWSYKDNRSAAKQPVGIAPSGDRINPATGGIIRSEGGVLYLPRSNAASNDDVQEELELKEHLKQKQEKPTLYCCKYGCEGANEVYGMCCRCAMTYMSKDPAVVASVNEFLRKKEIEQDRSRIPQSHWTPVQREILSKPQKRIDPHFIARDDDTTDPEQREWQGVACKRCGCYNWEWADLIGNDEIDGMFPCCSFCYRLTNDQVEGDAEIPEDMLARLDDQFERAMERNGFTIVNKTVEDDDDDEPIADATAVAVQAGIRSCEHCNVGPPLVMYTGYFLCPACYREASSEEGEEPEGLLASSLVGETDSEGNLIVYRDFQEEMTEALLEGNLITGLVDAEGQPIEDGAWCRDCGGTNVEGGLCLDCVEVEDDEDGLVYAPQQIDEWEADEQRENGRKKSRKQRRKEAKAAERERKKAFRFHGGGVLH